MSRHFRLLLVALVCALLPGTVMTTMASGGHPAPPPGFRPATGPPAGALVETELLTIPAAQCDVMNKGLASQGLAPVTSCEVEHRSYGVNHGPLPAGSKLAGALFSNRVAQADAAYWYWYRWDEICSIYGCWYMSFTLSEDGVANGSNVWQWNVGCSPGGINTSISWCGSLYNGGGWPYYAMQFGLNGQACVILSGGTVCAQHGMRRWIDDWGNPGGFSRW
jgi:hypothetical protein